jgi:pimeloyl-ACP methyl ester carboxylesterase
MTQSANKREYAFKFDLAEFGTIHASNRKPPRGRIFSIAPKDGRLGYFGFIPKKQLQPALPFVTIHGISRNAAEHIFRFRPIAEQRGVAVIAPLFPKSIHRRFQRLRKGSDGIRAVDAFNRTLDAAAKEMGLSFDQFRIFGHSAGGQFAHRYLMAFPDRADRAALFAPGWYSFPTREHKYPTGIGGERSPIQDLTGFFDIDIQVLVGERDTVRDATLRTSRRLDTLQGRNRVERARAWALAMREAAMAAGAEPRIRLLELEGAGHSFRQNCENHRLGELVFSHLYG